MSKINDETMEVGKEILSYCGKCKEDSTHIISAMEKDKLSKVMCKTCNARHNYRKPKSQVESKTADKPIKKAKSTTTRKVQKTPTEKWDDLLANYDLSDAQNYSMKKNYKESSIINHPSFGIGVVTKRIDQKKMEVQFKAGIKRLVTNRG